MSEKQLRVCASCDSCDSYASVRGTDFKVMQVRTFTTLDSYVPQTQTQVCYYTEMLVAMVDSSEALPQVLRDLGEEGLSVVQAAVKAADFQPCFGQHLLVAQPTVDGRPPRYVLLLGLKGANPESLQQDATSNSRRLCALFGFMVETADKHDVTRLLVAFEGLGRNNVDVLAAAALLRCRCRRVSKVTGANLPEVMVICTPAEKPEVELGLGIFTGELCNPCTDPKLNQP